MINTKTLIEEIQRRFPSFALDTQFKDLITIIGGDMVDFISESLEKNTLVEEIVEFLNETVESSSSDTDLKSFLSEIILGLNDSKYKSNYTILRNLLSKDAQQYFDHSLALWLKGNKKADFSNGARGQ